MSVSARPLGCYLTELLAAHGIDTIFGIPGVHNLELYRGLDRHRQLRHVLVRHEQGAGFAADGYARSTGRKLCSSARLQQFGHTPGPRSTQASPAPARGRVDGHGLRQFL